MTEPAVFAVSIAEVIFDYGMRQKNPESAMNIITDSIVYMKIEKMIKEKTTELVQDLDE